MRFCENSRCRNSRCLFSSASLAFFASISSFLSCIFRSAIFALPAGCLLSALASSSSPLLLLLLLETTVLNRVVCPTACLEPLLAAALLSSLALMDIKILHKRSQEHQKIPERSISNPNLGRKTPPSRRPGTSIELRSQVAAVRIASPEIYTLCPLPLPRYFSRHPCRWGFFLHFRG